MGELVQHGEQIGEVIGLEWKAAVTVRVARKWKAALDVPLSKLRPFEGLSIPIPWIIAENKRKHSSIFFNKFSNMD